MTAAINQDAVVRREYNVNGTMRSETQRIRTYAGLDTTAHVYRLEYGYDLNGRRTFLTHPQIFETISPRGTWYGYDSIAGALALVSDPNGGGYTYRYDLAGRLDQRTRGSVVEAFSYDSLGRLEHRVETSGGVAVHDDHLVYKDSTGKLVSVTANKGSADLAYTGMGALAYSDETDRTGRGIRKTEQYDTDALANQISTSFWSTPLSTANPAEADTYVRIYEPATGRLIRSQSSSVPGISYDSSTYDPAGSRVFSGSRRAGRTPYALTRDTDVGTIRDEGVDAITDERATYYYGADERLRVVDRRGCLSFHPAYERQACDQQYEPAFEKKSAFEEYRYDALGRRVLVRTRQEYACTTNCFRQLRRAIWDGDQLLYEIAAPGASGTLPSVMERDTGLGPNFKNGFYPTGRVEYVHGAELDAPLAMYRAEYSDSIEGGYYVPLANWKGSYDSGYSIEYCYTREWSTAVAPPIGEAQTGSDTTKSNATSGTETLCPTAEWPAQHEWAARQYRRGYGGPRNWMGSLIYGQRDFSGLHYRRNRFYDSEQGRFTQEDPIGMAGGINLYGFANGDPVGYSDRYGLRADTLKAYDRGGEQFIGGAAFVASLAAGSADERTAEAGRAILTVLRVLDAHPTHLIIGVNDEGRTGTGGFTDGTGREGIRVNPTERTNSNNAVRFAHELGHSYARIIFGTKDVGNISQRQFQNEMSLRMENHMRVIYGCAPRTFHGTDRQAPAC